MDEDNITQPETEIENTSPVTNESEETLKPEEPKPEKKKSKKTLLVVLIVLFLIAAGVAAWFLSNGKDQPEQTTNQTQQTTDSSSDQSKKLFGVSYSYGDAEKAGMELFWRPIAGGDRRSAKNIGQNNYIASSGTYANQVFVETSAGSGSSDGASIWYSNDSGKTYENILELDLPKPDQVGQQITSIVFSKDGSKLLFGFLDEGNKGNTIREIDLKTKAISDLFTVNTAGVFIEGYDSEKKQVYYFTGCFNCDGNTRSKLFVRDLNTKQETVLFDTPDKITMEFVMRNDFAKILIVSGVQGDGLGGGPPYTIEEFDVAAKTFDELLVLDDNDGYPKIGYRDPDNLPYFSEGNSVKVISVDGTQTTVFEATKPIVEVLYVGNDQVIASSGVFEDYSLSNYTISSKAVVEILKGDQSTTLFGVTSE